MKKQQNAVTEFPSDIPYINAQDGIALLRDAWDKKLNRRKKSMAENAKTPEEIADYQAAIDEAPSFHTVTTNSLFQSAGWFGCDVTLERIEKAVQEHGAWDLKDYYDAPVCHTIGIKLDDAFCAVDIEIH